MRDRHPTEAELRENFETEFAAARSGQGLHSETGLDLATELALEDIAIAYPDVPDRLTAAARAAFAGQLDGANAARRRAEIVRLIAEHQSRGSGDQR